MPAKVFVSCGQAVPEERRVAEQIGIWLDAEGFIPYVATETQTLLDLNSDIIAELRTSDYYLFINFARETVRSAKGDSVRGSVYTNQELAMAYALGFEKFILVNQKGTTREGLHWYMVSNTPEFERYDEVLSIVKSAISKSQWSPDFSRHLAVLDCTWTDEITYGDHTGRYCLKILEGRLANNRPDEGASATVARLSAITDPSGVRYQSPDLSPLKVAGQQGYSQTIWPKGYGRLALLALNVARPSSVYLNSALDIIPRAPIITTPGSYVLEYEAYATGFPPLSFVVELDFTGDHTTTDARLHAGRTSRSIGWPPASLPATR